MNLVESEMCSFCKGEQETVEHLFLNCRIAKTLLIDICNLCKETMSFPVLSFKNIICGFTESSEQNICQNFVLLLFKKFLYQQRSRQSGPGPTSKVLVTVSIQYTESNTKLRLQTTNLIVILRSGSILSICFPQEEQQLHQTEYFNVVKK